MILITPLMSVVDSIPLRKMKKRLSGAFSLLFFE